MNGVIGSVEHGNSRTGSARLRDNGTRTRGRYPNIPGRKSTSEFYNTEEGECIQTQSPNQKQLKTTRQACLLAQKTASTPRMADYGGRLPAFSAFARNFSAFFCACAQEGAPLCASRRAKTCHGIDAGLSKNRANRETTSPTPDHASSLVATCALMLLLRRHVWLSQGSQGRLHFERQLPDSAHFGPATECNKRRQVFVFVFEKTC